MPLTGDDIRNLSVEDKLLLEQRVFRPFWRIRYLVYLGFRTFRTLFAFTVGSAICVGIVFGASHDGVQGVKGDGPRWQIALLLVALLVVVVYLRFARRVFLSLWRWPN